MCYGHTRSCIFARSMGAALLSLLSATAFAVKLTDRAPVTTISTSVPTLTWTQCGDALGVQCETTLDFDISNAPWRVRTSAPLLVVDGYFDPVNEDDGALAVHRLPKYSGPPIYSGWEHNAFSHRQCARKP